ncbi:MAG: hypothetical protein ACYC6L_07930, partial [Anaerolineae bacterium]
SFALALQMGRCQSSLKQQVLFASLPDGTALVHEKLEASRDIVVKSVKNGFMRIINERYAPMIDNCCGQRMLYSALGEQTFHGYVNRDPSSDVTWQAHDLSWLNLDDRLGILFQSQGPTTYLNRHYFQPWWAVADDLILGQQQGIRSFRAGDLVSSFTAVFMPDQSHTQTQQQAWQVVSSPDNPVVAIIARGYLAAANWNQVEFNQPIEWTRSARQLVPIIVGSSTITPERAAYALKLKGNGAGLKRIAAWLDINGTAEIEAAESGRLWIHNISNELTRIGGLPGTSVLTLSPGEVVVF